MRKFLFYLLLFTSALTLPAGSYYSKLGKYSNVTILKVDHNGIQISHSYGICYITEKDLSPAEKYRLNRQLQLHKEKITKHEKSKQKNSVIQLRKLQKLAAELPKMSKSEIESWALREVKVSVVDPKFKDKFMEKFCLVNGDEEIEAEEEVEEEEKSSSSKNKITNEKVLAQIFDRLKKVIGDSIGIKNYFDLRKKMLAMSDTIPDMSLDDIENWISNALDCKLHATEAVNKWKKKFKDIDFSYNMHLAEHPDTGLGVNEYENSEDIFSRLLDRASELQHSEIADLKKQLSQKNNKTVDMLQRKFGSSVENNNFESKFNEKYCFVENRDQIAKQIKQQVQRSERRAPQVWADWQIRQAQMNYRSSQSRRICANCRGSGKRDVYVYGAWRTIRCNSCNGSGDAGFTAEYIDSNGRRHRSVMEQNLGRMMGAF